MKIILNSRLSSLILHYKTGLLKRYTSLNLTKQAVTVLM